MSVHFIAETIGDRLVSCQFINDFPLRRDSRPGPGPGPGYFWFLLVAADNDNSEPISSSGSGSRRGQKQTRDHRSIEVDSRFLRIKLVNPTGCPKKNRD